MVKAGRFVSLHQLVERGSSVRPEFWVMTPGPETALRGGVPRALDRALEDADRMTQGEDLQLKGGTGLI